MYVIQLGHKQVHSLMASFMKGTLIFVLSKAAELWLESLQMSVVGTSNETQIHRNSFHKDLLPFIVFFSLACLQTVFFFFLIQ